MKDVINDLKYNLENTKKCIELYKEDNKQYSEMHEKKAKQLAVAISILEKAESNS